jgi:hypothetical protein
METWNWLDIFIIVGVAGSMVIGAILSLAMVLRETKKED